MSPPQSVKERQSSCPTDNHVTSSEKITQMLPHSPVALYSCGPKPCEDTSMGNGWAVRMTADLLQPQEGNLGHLHLQPLPLGVDLKFILCDTCGNPLAEALNLRVEGHSAFLSISCSQQQAQLFAKLLQ